MGKKQISAAQAHGRLMTPLMVPGASEDLKFYSARSQAESATELSAP